MAGLVPAIHVFNDGKDVDARNKCGHDDLGVIPGERSEGWGSMARSV
jgi:hypothetical protein